MEQEATGVNQNKFKGVLLPNTMTKKRVGHCAESG